MNSAELFAKLSKSFQNRIPYILIGGFAVNAYEYSRFTADIDFMILETDFEKAKEYLATVGYSPFEQTSLYARFQSKDPKQMIIDLLFVDLETLNAILKEARKTTIAKNEFFIPSLDHLIALKLHALKNNFSHRVGKDLRDIVELILINKINAKAESFKNLCLRYGTPELYHEILKSIP